jgi:hypothetical protein
MSEETEEKKGFFSEIKTQIIGLITLVLTTGGTLIATHMEQLFGVDKEEEKTEVAAPVAAAPIINITNTNQQSQQVAGKTIIIKEKASPSQAAPAVVVKPKKTETEKRKEDELDW